MQNVDEICGQLVEDTRELYGDNLLSVILYGSGASSDYVEGKSDINCVVLLKQVTLEELKKCRKHFHRWRKNAIVPLFLDPAYVRSSVDVFPIEFLDMKERYRVLYGQDFLRDIEVRRENLRFQCEQELKGKMLRLRQLYLERADSMEALKSLMTKSLSSFAVLFKALLRLKAVPAPQPAEDLLARLSELGLPTKALARVYRLRREDTKLRREELELLFEQYLDEVQAAVNFVDRMKLT